MTRWQDLAVSRGPKRSRYTTPDRNDGEERQTGPVVLFFVFFRREKRPPRGSESSHTHTPPKLGETILKDNRNGIFSLACLQKELSSRYPMARPPPAEEEKEAVFLFSSVWWCLVRVLLGPHSRSSTGEGETDSSEKRRLTL